MLAGRNEAGYLQEALEALSLTVHDFDAEMALAATELHRAVPRNLSIGDRACLALARRLRLPAVTAEKEWTGLTLDGLVVQAIR